MSQRFQFFEGPATESAEVARITVRKGGLLVLSGAAVVMLGEGAEQVQVGFDPETRAVGLRAVEAGVPGSYRLRQQGEGPARLVDGKRVFSHHGLSVDRAQSYPAQSFGDGVVGFVFGVEDGGSEEGQLAAPKTRRRGTTADREPQAEVSEA